MSLSSYLAISASTPDANDNLGALEVSVNKAEVALPVFKTALEANPKPISAVS